MPHPLQFDLLTLFPRMLDSILEASMLGRARQRGLIDVRTHDLRDWTEDSHRTTDDRPFGGGAGMVLKPEPVVRAWEALDGVNATTIYLSPDGEPLTTPLAQELAAGGRLLLISGHYEGLDERAREHCVDREVSVGDYILTNGTLAAGVLIDAVSRFVPGVLGESESLEQDAFADGLLGHPQYTRPEVFRGQSVPEILLSGHHARIEAWRHEQRLERTRQRRPDLLDHHLSAHRSEAL